MRRFKIVSDFDGVWTDQTGEARVIRERLVREVAAVTGQAVSTTRDRIDGVVREIQAEPHAHGWAPQGRITAFIDEDPLCSVNAFCLELERGHRADLEDMRGAVLEAGFDSLHAFADHCVSSGIREFRATRAPDIIAHASEVLEGLNDAGADLVIVSNSESEKLIHYFAAVGVTAGEAPDAPLRVRGDAAKWHLGPGRRTLEIHDRVIPVDRPRYRATLEAERPDLVIGDVFSLDLSLPHAMREGGEEGAPDLLVVRRHPHTPEWVHMDRAGGAVDHVVDDLRELVDITRASTEDL